MEFTSLICFLIFYANVFRGSLVWDCFYYLSVSFAESSYFRVFDLITLGIRAMMLNLRSEVIFWPRVWPELHNKLSAYLIPAVTEKNQSQVAPERDCFFWLLHKCRCISLALVLMKGSFRARKSCRKNPAAYSFPLCLQPASVYRLEHIPWSVSLCSVPRHSVCSQEERWQTVRGGFGRGGVGLGLPYNPSYCETMSQPGVPGFGVALWEDKGAK